MFAPAAGGAVVEGEDDEESVYSDAGSRPEEGDDAGGTPPRDPRRPRGSSGSPAAQVGRERRLRPPGAPPAAVRRIPLTQNQLKLTARLDVFERKHRNNARNHNDRALAQLRATTASLQRATQSAQGAKRVLDGAFEELRRLCAAPPSGTAALGGPDDGQDAPQDAQPDAS